MGTVDRLVRYAQVFTESKLGTGKRPSTACQLDLTKMLYEEMKQIGISNVRMNEMAYVYGEIPATSGYEDRPAIGFIAHIDTAPDFSGKDVHPRVIENYDGNPIELGAGRVLDPKQFPHLKNLTGDTLVVTDGTTLLGGDDKAGVAVIMSACEKLLNSDMPHGKICVAFNPDEEIGEGPWDFDVEAFGADYAYTVDFTRAGDIIYECFNAAYAMIDIRGFNSKPKVLLVSPLCAGTGACGHVDLDFGVFQHDGTDITAVHDEAFRPGHFLLTGNEIAPYVFKLRDIARRHRYSIFPDRLTDILPVKEHTSVRGKLDVRIFKHGAYRCLIIERDVFTQCFESGAAVHCTGIEMHVIEFLTELFGNGALTGRTRAVDCNINTHIS